jgi:hypothetical protein
VEAIVWGGDIDFAYGKPDVYLDVGGRYDPYSDTWAAITPRVEPERPVFDAAVWTGSEVVAWGRTYEPWARFDPIADLWQPTSTTGAPLSSYRWRRLAFGVVWTDIELILWGGLTRTNRHNTGARYNPVTDSWVDTSTTDAPMARDGHSMVWAEEIGLMLVWGDRWGSTVGEVLNDGGRYDPATDSWTPITTQNAPTGGRNHSAVWTGTEIIVWGGATQPGGRYNPSTDTWVSMSSTDEPTTADDPFRGPGMVWTGTEVIV